MDHAVKSSVAIALFAACALHLARAQALADPTRPPSTGARPATAAPGGAVSAAPVLQSVLIGQSGGRQVAVIDGETVRLGSSFRGAVVVRISETEVELKRGQQRQVLKLYGGAGSSATERAK